MDWNQCYLRNLIFLIIFQIFFFQKEIRVNESIGRNWNGISLFLLEKFEFSFLYFGTSFTNEDNIKSFFIFSIRNEQKNDKWNNLCTSRVRLFFFNSFSKLNFKNIFKHDCYQKNTSYKILKTTLIHIFYLRNFIYYFSNIVWSLQLPQFTSQNRNKCNLLLRSFPKT